MVRDANGRNQAVVGDIPGLLWVKCVGRYYSGNRYELQFSSRRKTAWFASQILCWTIWRDIISWSLFCSQFLLSDNYPGVSNFTSWRTYVRWQNIFCFSCFAQQNFIKQFSGFLSFFFSRSLNQHHNFTNIFRSVLLVSGFAIQWYQCYSCGLHPFPANQYFQDSRFMTCLRFRIFTIMFFSFFLFAHSQKVKQSLCPKNNVACRHRWHAKPFSVVN